MNAKISLAVQSWSFRHLTTLEDLMSALDRCGITQVELSRAYFNAFQPGNVIARLADRGITAFSAGVLRFTADEAQNRAFLAMAADAHFPFLPADFDDSADLGRVARLAREYGVKLALHNHGRRHRYGSWRAMKEFLALEPETFQLCLDTAWLLDAGEDPVALLPQLAGHLAEVHLKDFIFDRAGAPHDTVIGEGNLDLPAFLAVLTATGFSGPLTIEYEGAPETVEPAVRRSVELLRGC